MTILGLIILVVASVAAAYFAQRLPPPWPWAIYAILVILWLLVFVWVSGLDGGLLSQRVA